MELGVHSIGLVKNTFLYLSTFLAIKLVTISQGTRKIHHLYQLTIESGIRYTNEFASCYPFKHACRFAKAFLDME